ncbi:MAG TPA: hypothetical protein VNA89_09305 [Gemmatimonadaceae bacterium]|nr:hypothetical protein [Gemmatimonadaceae bacterium]
MDEKIVVPLGFFVMMVLIAIGVPLVRALARRWDRESAVPKIPAEVAARLERMEQAIDAVAVEVERISEGQRFMTKLLGDRGAEARLPASTDRTT